MSDTHEASQQGAPQDMPHGPGQSHPPKSRAQELEAAFEPAHLAQLRPLLERPTFRPLLLAGLLRLQVVVDANCVVQSLMYREKHPACPATALEEAIRSSVLEVYTPRWLDEEMPSAISQAAIRNELPPGALWRHWEALRPLLRWVEVVVGEEYPLDSDPKDVPYLGLEKQICAAGILSEDKDIRRMGGHPLGQKFLLDTKRYARAAGVSVSLRIGGVVVTALTAKVAVEAIRGLGRLFGRLPPAVQATLLVGGLAAILHPEPRRWLSARLESFGVAALPAFRAGMDGIARLAAVCAESQARAETHLQMINSAVRPRPA